MSCIILVTGYFCNHTHISTYTMSKQPPQHGIYNLLIEHFVLLNGSLALQLLTVIQVKILRAALLESQSQAWKSLDFTSPLKQSLPAACLPRETHRRALGGWWTSCQGVWRHLTTASALCVWGEPLNCPQSQSENTLNSGLSSGCSRNRDPTAEAFSKARWRGKLTFSRAWLIYYFCTKKTNIRRQFKTIIHCETSPWSPE